MNVSTKTNSLQCTFTEEVLSVSLLIAHRLLLGTRNKCENPPKKKKNYADSKDLLCLKKQNSAPTPEFELRKSFKKKKTKQNSGLKPLKDCPLPHCSSTHSPTNHSPLTLSFLSTTHYYSKLEHSRSTNPFPFVQSTTVSHP
jgi:hypothetical protein